MDKWQKKLRKKKEKMRKKALKANYKFGKKLGVTGVHTGKTNYNAYIQYDQYGKQQLANPHFQQPQPYIQTTVANPQQQYPLSSPGCVQSQPFYPYQQPFTANQKHQHNMMIHQRNQPGKHSKEKNQETKLAINLRDETSFS